MASQRHQSPALIPPLTAVFLFLWCFFQMETCLKKQKIYGSASFRSAMFLPLIVTIFIVSATTVECANSTSCNSGNSAKSVPYPFGFSQSNLIRLNCSENGDIMIGTFVVLNFSADTILVNVPAICNHSIQSVSPLFGKNFWPTNRNNLLLQGCHTPGNCPFPSTFLPDQILSANCDAKNHNLSCFFQNTTGKGFLASGWNQNECQFLYSSIIINSELNRTVSLAFQTIELQWWLEGTCKCSKNAILSDISLPTGNFGCRCRCREGYQGDGYANGEGCWRIDPGGKINMGIGTLVGGILASAFLMAGLALACYLIRRRVSCMKDQMSAKRLVSEAARNSTVPIYSFKEIERATNGFSEKQRLGTGAFGTVYAGKIFDDHWVAIKRIKYRDHNSIDQVMNEIRLLSSVSHPNLVRLLGCSIEEGQQILVYEFMPNGTLSQQLQREKGSGLPWTTRLTIAAETARAIAYLHSAMHPPIYHRDIKSSNILLDYNFKSKVADFGLSRLGITESSHISTAPQGTPGYLDPQYHQNFHLSDKSDVYSFGVVLLEIITAMKVVDFTRPQGDVTLAALAIDRIGRGCVDEIIDPFLEPNRDAWTLYSVHKVAELAFRCLAFHSETRPTMMEVAEELETIRHSGWATLEETICVTSSVGSACSSPRNGSEKSASGSMVKRAGLGGQMLIVPPQNYSSHFSRASMEEEVTDSSPVSVQDPWFSEQSSPSTNSLLGNVIH